MPTSKPEPVVVRTVCSLCDEPWESHGDKPTTLDCIRLLKAKRYVPTITYPYQWTWTNTGMANTTATAATTNYIPFNTAAAMPTDYTTVYKTPVTA